MHEALRRSALVRTLRPCIIVGQTRHAGGRWVRVAVESRRGATTVMEVPDTEAGHDACLGHARTLSTITGLPLVDCRPFAHPTGDRALAHDTAWSAPEPILLTTPAPAG